MTNDKHTASAPPHWTNLVLASEFVGGAEIFGLERLLVRGGRVHANTKLARMIAADSRYGGLHIVEHPALDALATRISLPNIRTAALALRSLLADADCVLGNLRVASLALTGKPACCNDAFVHDNTHYLNLKARMLMAAIALRARRLFVPCHHAVGRLPLGAALRCRIHVDYFAAWREVPSQPVEGRTLRLINVGRIEPNKNQRLCVQVAAELAQSFGAVELLLLGQPSPDRYLDELVAQARATPNLTLRQTVARRDEVPAILAQHDALVHTSLIESLPLVLFEANAAGIPAFACPSGGIPEVLPVRFQLPANAEEAARTILAVLRPSTTEKPS